jgi:hypothetical protein
MPSFPDRREISMRRLIKFVLVPAALLAMPWFAHAAEGGLTGSTPPASGLIGQTQKHHKHHPKPAGTATDDRASKDAAGAATAGAAIKAPKTDPTLNKLNTVLPP